VLQICFVVRISTISSSPYNAMSGSGGGGPAPTRCGRFGMPAMRLLGGCMGATTIALGVYDIAQDSGNVKNVVNNIYRILVREATAHRMLVAAVAEDASRVVLICLIPLWLPWYSSVWHFDCSCRVAFDHAIDLVFVSHFLRRTGRILHLRRRIGDGQSMV
jgi:uncharacterized protein (UPF0264 family)